MGKKYNAFLNQGHQLMTIPQQKMKLCSYRDFVYPVVAAVLPKNKEAYELFVRSICDSTARSYMTRFRTKEVSDNVFTASASSGDMVDNCTFSICRHIRRISREHDLDRDLCVVMRSEHYSAMLRFGKTMNEKEYEAVITFCDAVKDLCAVTMIDIDMNRTENVTIRNGMRTTVYLARNKKVAESAASDSQLTIMGIVEPKMLYYLDQLLSTARELLKTPYDEWLVPRYNSAEMMLFKATIADIGASYWSYSVAGWCVNPETSGVLDILNESIPEWVLPNADIHEVPQIQLGPKEFKFIENYVTKNEKFGVGLHSNLTPYLTNARYGDVMRLPCWLDSGTKSEIVVYWKVVPEKNAVRFHLVERLNEHFSTLIIVDCGQLDDFTPFTNISDIRYDVCYTSTDEMLPSLEEIYNASALLRCDHAHVMYMLDRIIKLLIAIHDRPERTKMIKCTEKRKVKNPKTPKAPVEEKDYIVWRILKPVKEAKEYLASVSMGSHRDAEYVMEEWPRVGHYRRTPSGRQIWIEATTCKRHLPLTKKEIHIKL